MENLFSNFSGMQQTIYLLLPGFLFIIFFLYQIPSKKRSDLEIIIWSVFISVVLSSLTGWLLSLLTLKYTSVEFNLTNIFLGLFFALTLAKIMRSQKFGFINRKFLGIKIFPFSRLWNDFFNTKENTVVKVFMNNGIIYVGVIRNSSVDPNDDIQELELWKPMYFDKELRKLTTIKETVSVLLNGNSIISVEKISDEESKQLYAKNRKKK